MTLSELNSSLTKDLKAYIKIRGYVDSGNLLKSVKFKCSFKDSSLKIKLNAADYIVYLEDGELLNNFYELESTRDTVAEFVASNIDLGLNEKGG